MQQPNQSTKSLIFCHYDVSVGLRKLMNLSMWTLVYPSCLGVHEHITAIESNHNFTFAKIQVSICYVSSLTLTTIYDELNGIQIVLKWQIL